MATLRIHSSVLIVKYLTNNNGKPYYQRRIPEDLQDRFGKKKFSIALDPHQGSPVIQVQKLAKSHDALFKALREHPNLALTEEKLAALALLQSFGLKPGAGNERLNPWDPGAEFDDQPHLSDFHDFLIDSDRAGGLSKSEEFALKALQGPLPVLLSELPEVYFESHARGQEPKFRKKTQMYWDRLLEFVGDMPLESLTRDHARAFKKHREASAVRSATVQKDLNIIKAILSVAIRELSLNLPNPFGSIKASNLGKDAEKKPVFEPDELKLILKESLAKNDDIRRIVTLLLLTGARIGEIVGLRKEDCVLDEPIPYIAFREYGKRRLKTKNSIRDMPLVPIAQTVILDQLAEAKGDYLFPRYNDGIEAPNADSASAATNKWLKEVLKIEKTSHSFRHTMKDLFRNADVTEDINQQVLGHGAQTITQNYGKGLAMAKRLQVLEKALALVFREPF